MQNEQVQVKGTNLPALPPYHIQRRELSIIEDMLAANKLVSLIGGPAIGKRSLALAVAHRTPEEVWYVDLTAAQCLSEAIYRIAVVVGFDTHWDALETNLGIWVSSLRPTSGTRKLLCLIGLNADTRSLLERLDEHLTVLVTARHPVGGAELSIGLMHPDDLR